MTPSMYFLVVVFFVIVCFRGLSRWKLLQNEYTATETSGFAKGPYTL